MNDSSTPRQKAGIVRPQAALCESDRVLLLSPDDAASVQPDQIPALLGQLAFYLWAAMGFLFRQRMQSVRFGLLGYYLLAIHLAFLVGFVRFLGGSKEAAWQRVN